MTIFLLSGPCRGVRTLRGRVAGAGGGPVVAVDGGVRHLAPLGLAPDLIVGDLDTAPAGVVERWERRGVQVLRYPPEKDEIDLELAMAAVPRPRRLLVVGALGGRDDMALANVFCLSPWARKGTRVELLDPRQPGWLLGPGRHRLSLTQGISRVSLLPLTDEVTGLSSRGLAWALRGDTLDRESGRGLSNEPTAGTVSLAFVTGVLLVLAA